MVSPTISGVGSSPSVSPKKTSKPTAKSASADTLMEKLSPGTRVTVATRFSGGRKETTTAWVISAVLQTPLPVSGERPLLHLFRRLDERTWRVYADDSPFDYKDLLKERSYRWDATARVWHRTLGEAAMREEIRWLKENIYKQPKVTLTFESFNARTRFSNRPGRRYTKDV